jgi:N-acetyl-1-D-myo-inositol-2-amino-2-deoxy-alpha-D-glucopyranoside deacetylase
MRPCWWSTPAQQPAAPLAEEMRVLRPGTAYHSLDPAGLGRDDAAITDVLDATGVLDRREAAMAEHRSQASPFDGLSPELRRAFLATDHLARVDAPPHLT